MYEIVLTSRGANPHIPRNAVIDLDPATTRAMAERYANICNRVFHDNEIWAGKLRHAWVREVTS